MVLVLLFATSVSFVAWWWGFLHEKFTTETQRGSQPQPN
jgi:hypothetical protein